MLEQDIPPTSLGGSLAGLPLRSPVELMNPDTLGRFKASRLSFGPNLIAKMIKERWQIERASWQLGSDGRGLAWYRILPPGGHELNFVALSVLVPGEDQVGDAYAHKFDVQASVIEGPVTEEYLERFQVEIQRHPTEGMAGYETLAWARANRSSRAFDTVVAALAAGTQPDPAWLCGIGYLLRTEYYQANGVCGTRQFAAYTPDHPLRLPYASQSLASYMLREFGNDLADHLARQASPRAVTLAPELRRYMGLGNSTGLGLVIFVVNHPRLIDRWIAVREMAVAYARNRDESAGGEAVRRFRRLLDRCIVYRDEDTTTYGLSFLSGPALAADLRQVGDWLHEFIRTGRMDGTVVTRPWDALFRLTQQHLHPETVESVASLLVDTYPETADSLARLEIVEGIDELHAEIHDVDPTMTIGELREIVGRDYRWALEMDLSRPDSRYWAWYKDLVGEYPGVIPRQEITDTHGFKDYAWDFAGSIQRLDGDMADLPSSAPVAELIALHPTDRGTVQWIQTVRGHPYSTVRMNMLDVGFKPMIITRFVLEALKGFEKMKPVEAHGGRALLMQGAPTAAQISAGVDDLWMYPAIPKIVPTHSTERV